MGGASKNRHAEERQSDKREKLRYPVDAAQSSWYLSLFRRVRDGAKRNEAFCLEFTNCRSQRLGSRIGGTLAFLSIIDRGARAPREQPLARQHPHYGGVMPSITTRGRQA
jgi:hypothetical protein